VSKRRAKKVPKPKVKPKATKAPSKKKTPSKGKVISSPVGPFAGPRGGGEAMVKALTDLAGKEPKTVEDVMSELRQITKRLSRTSSMVCDETEFRRQVEHLRTMCPTPKGCKVMVSRCDPEEMTEMYGYVTKYRNTFEVVLSNNLTEYETTHILLHEWAHVLGWRPYHPLQGDHGGDWGVWYATIWRKYHGVE
jgi:hypothetical protein